MFGLILDCWDFVNVIHFYHSDRLIGSSADDDVE